MSEETVVSIKNMSKSYRMYRSPSEKFKELLHPFGKKYHRDFWALKDVSFEIKKGESVGIIGRNGSGKSTLLKIICGILQPTEGEVKVSGRISALLELGAGFNPNFTGRENIYMNGAVMGFNKEEMDARVPSIIEFADIGDFIDQPVKTYSSGMYIRLAFACAVNIDPDILIVDEALAVGDDIFKRRCYRKMEDFQKQGKTIIIVTHSLGSIVSMCSKAILLNKGGLIEVGEPRDVVNTYNKLLSEVEKAYVRSGKGADKESKDAKSMSIEKIGIVQQAAVSAVECEEVSVNTATSRKQKLTGMLDGVGNREKSAETTPSEYRYGTGEAELIEIEIIDLKGELANVIMSGETCIIRLKAFFKKEMKNPVIGFTIRTLNGINLLGTNTDLSECRIGSVAQGMIIEVEFEQRMILSPGAYTLTSAIGEICENGNVFHDRRMDVLVFKVISSKRSHGLITIETPVRIKTLKPEKV